jgi:hypothetical protein
MSESDIDPEHAVVLSIMLDKIRAQQAYSQVQFLSMTYVLVSLFLVMPLVFAFQLLSWKESRAII